MNEHNPFADSPSADSRSADSAGQPWAGRSFGETAYADDDGTAPAQLMEALRRFRRRESDESVVVDALRNARLLIPLVANLGESAVNDRGVTVDKSADLSIVTVAGPDGRNVLPVFSSVDAMRRWNPKARPVPADAIRVALAAADEQTDLVVLDPTSESEFVLRRPALWAIAQSLPWSPSHADAEVLAEFANGITGEAAIVAISLTAGDPDANLSGPELIVELGLIPGLDQVALGSLIERVQMRWSGSAVIAERVDSLSVKLVPAEPRPS